MLTRPNARRHAAGLLTLCVSLLGACSDADRTSPLAPEAGRHLSAAPAGADATAQQLARAFAAAMNDADVRVQVRNAMRGSTFNEHKLVLQDFATTRAGRRLVQAAARASGTTEVEIDALISSLPAMDFYAPFQAHRLTWRGGAEVAVGAAMDVDAASFTAYTSGGQPVSHKARAAAPGITWLFLHPAETKSPRQKPQANTPGSVIQDPDDGIISISCATCVTEEPGDGTGGGSGSGGGATMILDRFVSNVFDGIGAAELRFIVRNASNTEIAAHTFPGYDADWDIQRVVNYTFPRGSYLHVREIDTWDSDDQGTYPIYVIPGWVAAEEINCYFHYEGNYAYSSRDAEHMCGPNSWLEAYKRVGPLWRAYLR
jgi:hypothetical protein